MRNKPMYEESIDGLTALKNIHAAEGLLKFYQQQLDDYYESLRKQGINVNHLGDNGEPRFNVFINGYNHIFETENEMIIFLAEHFLEDA